ncbi:MAG: serine/threonine protein kinase, partial [Planctomycetota bacterium]
MGKSRHRIVEEIFQDASDLPPDRRGAFLDERCGDDRSLRSEVEALLHHDEEGDPAFLAGRLDGDDGGAAPHAPGTMIGQYQLLDLIGEGAFGDVYLAEQFEPVRRKVALKIVKLGMDTREVVTRFEAERQALAMMDHANIARVFDAGTTGTGRPYFVMEHVPGVPINRFCDEKRFDTEQRLAIFGQVCEAIQHAHQKGIIHRDLKPSN